MISKIYQRPDVSYFQEIPKLQSQMDTQKLVQRFLPKKADIDRVLKIILEGTYLLVNVKEMQSAHILKTCIYILHRINCLIPRQH